RETGRHRSHQNRYQPFVRATLDRLAEVGDALFGHQMLNVRHQHDAVACRDAEERDEPDHGRDAQHATGEKYARNAANQRERQIDHDDDRITSAAERQHQQHEESGDHSDEQDPEAPGGALLTLELSPVLDAVSRRHRRRLRDVRPDVVDHAAEISAGDVAGNHDPALHVLAQDHVRSFLTSYVSSRRIGTWPDVSVSIGRSAIRSKSPRLDGSNFTTRSNAVPRSKMRPTVAPAKLVSIASPTSLA